MTIDASPTSRIDVLEQYVGRTATALQAGYLADLADAVAKLARLRRAVPSGRQLSPDAWDVFEGMPDQLIASGDEPSEAEFAAVAALALFAIHQQSRREAGMHRQGRDHTLGRAVARLTRAVDRQGVDRRFRALTRSADIVAALQNLRGLVTQLRAERIGLDYGALARDLYNLQYPSSIHTVRMRWTRDFHRPTGDDGNPGAEAATTHPTGDTQ
jgi:CRISPR system Cascade subunit CasB